MRLIINADDFGISEEVNNSVLSLHKKGIVSSASIMAGGKAFVKARDIAHGNPKLGIGLHLCLDGDFCVGKNYNTLLNKESNRFYDIQDIIKRHLITTFNPDEIFREYCLQIEFVLNNKIGISHLDHHHHLHLYWPVLNQMIKAARKYGISFIRSQKILVPSHFNIFNSAYRNLHQIYLKSMLNTHGGYFEPGIIANGGNLLFYERLTELLSKKNVIAEIVLHPQKNNDPETRLFHADKIASLFKEHEIINYHDLDFKFGDYTIKRPGYGRAGGRAFMQQETGY